MWQESKEHLQNLLEEHQLEAVSLTFLQFHKQEKVFPPDPIAVKPVKEVIDEFRSHIRSTKGAWYLGSKLDMMV